MVKALEEELLTTEQARRLLKISRQTLYKLCERGEIQGKKVGAKYRFTKEALDSYLKNKPDSQELAFLGYEERELKGDFATAGIKKMAKRTFQELSSNVEELVVNAYDADTTVVRIILDYDKRTLSIVDDGNGMDEEALASYVIYGESEKSSSYRSPKFGRSPIGEYGMGGKLAITNLARKCRIITRRDGKEHIFDMNKEQLDKAKFLSDVRTKVYSKNCGEDFHGTSVFMEELLYKNIDKDRLVERLSTKMPKSQNFKIVMSVKQNKEVQEFEIDEPKFDYTEKFEFSEDLNAIGPVRLTIYYTNGPVPAAKQGIWTKVNGRIVNEKQEWFELERLTSGQRYRWRLYGIGEADGLKDFVTFSKNDFIDCPEYQEYYDFVHRCLSHVQNRLLKADEDAKKEQDRNLVKNIEREVNDVISHLDQPAILNNLATKIKKEFTKEIQDAPENPFADFEQVEQKADQVATVVKRGKDKRERRNQSLSKSEKMTYSGKAYTINTVDLSESGEVVKFTREKSLIEINERHSFYQDASKRNCLDMLIRDIAFTQIANDYTEGSLIAFNVVYNELAKIHVSTLRSRD